MIAEVEESVELQELTSVLDRNLVHKTVVTVETIQGVTIESRTVVITPALAEFLLTRNNHNRPLNKGNANKLALAMSNNEWQYDGTPISFDKYGKLLNGQHRLNGVIISGKSIIFKITSGFSPSIFATMDVGKVRTGSDVLAIAGIEDYKLIAQTANFVFQFLRGSVSVSASKASRSALRPNISLSHSQLLDFVEVNPSLKDSVKFQLKQKKTSGALLPSYVVSGLYFLFAEKNKQQAEEFLTGVLVGENLTSTQSMFHLRNRLVNSKFDKRNRLQHNEIVKLTVWAWNKFRTNARVKTLKIPETLPTIE